MRGRSPRSRRRPLRVPDVWVEAGDGRPLAAWVREPEPPAPDPVTAVLVHGWTSAASVWDRVVAEAAERRRAGAGGPPVRVVRYDQRGHGASREGPSGRLPAPGQPVPAASIHQLADDLAAVVAALAPRGPLVLVGHSMGGMAVLAAAGRHPELLGPRTRGVVLCSTSAGGLSSAGRPVAPLMAALAHLPPRVVVPRQPRLIAQRVNYGPHADTALVAATLRDAGSVSGRSTGEWFAALMDHDETAALPSLARAGTPVVVLVGEVDRLTPPPHARAIAQALPQARLRVVPDSGHMLVVERPDVVVDAVAEVLRAGEPPG